EGIDVRLIADRRPPVDDDMRFDAHAVAQLDLIADDDIRPDETVAAYFGARTDDCRRMDERRGARATRTTLRVVGRDAHALRADSRSAMTLMISASATKRPFTFASPRMR